jgi:hypothetical protein
MIAVALGAFAAVVLVRARDFVPISVDEPASRQDMAAFEP